MRQNQIWFCRIFLKIKCIVLPLAVVFSISDYYICVLINTKQ